MNKINLTGKRRATQTAAIALLISIVASAPVRGAEDVVGELRLSAAEEAATRLYTLDDTMQKNYAVTQRMVGYSVTPVILAMFNRVGGEYILYRKGKKVSVEPIPPLYRKMKSVSHTIVGVFEIIAPYFDNPKTGEWKPKLSEFNQMLKAGLATLGDAGILPEVEQHCRTILEGGIHFTDEALKTGTFSTDGYHQYTTSIWPSIEKNVALAGKLQVDNFEKVLQQWRKEMGEEGWSRLYAVVSTAWAMRRQNVHFQILAQMMGREAVNDRLILAESLKDATEDDLLMLLGRVINDRDLAVRAFGVDKKYRMDVELMGEAVRAETLKRSTPHHPAIDMKWMPYEQHKMPNEQ